jgi:hypothetical protein
MILPALRARVSRVYVLNTIIHILYTALLYFGTVSGIHSFFVFVASALALSSSFFSSWSSFSAFSAFSTCQTARPSSTSSSGIPRASEIRLPSDLWRSIFSTCSEFGLSAELGTDPASKGGFPVEYSSSRILEGLALMSLFSRRNSRCFEPDSALQCDQALKTR